MIIDKFYVANLTKVLPADSGHLTVHNADFNRLLELIPEGEQMYLKLQDDLYMEWALAENQCGAIVLSRGRGGTTARRFPVGSCVTSEAISPAILWTLCNYDCCSDPCPCIEIEAQDIIVPNGKIGIPWSCTAVFTGSLPMHFGVTNVPMWMTAETGANFIKFSGIPVAAGTSTIGIAGSNCSGRGTAAKTLVVTVTA